MIIGLSPVSADWPLPEVVYSKDALKIDGKLFDFGPLPDGGVLPPGAVASKWFDGEVRRVDGEIHLTLLLPYSVFPPSEAVAFPELIRVIKAGAVKLPFDAPNPPEETAYVD